MSDCPPQKRARENGTLSDMEVFDQLFHTLMEDLTKQGLKDAEIGDAIQWFKNVICLVFL